MDLIATKMDAKGNCGFPVPGWDTHNLVWYLIRSFRVELDWYASSSFEVLYIRMFMESWCSSSRLVHYWITRLSSIPASAAVPWPCHPALHSFQMVQCGTLCIYITCIYLYSYVWQIQKNSRLTPSIYNLQMQETVSIVSNSWNFILILKNIARNKLRI